MDAPTILMEYLKEQYVQARQHETRQTSATTILTAAAGVVLGFVGKNGGIPHSSWWYGVVLILIGIANFGINRAHHIGNRFHTKLAGKVRRELERACQWSDIRTPSELRAQAIDDAGLTNQDVGIGDIVTKNLQFVPLLIVALGFIVIVISVFSKC